MSRPSVFWLAILLALLIHLTSVYLVAPYLDVQDAEEKRRRAEPIEIVQAPGPHAQRKPVVETSRSQTQPDDSSTARFSGEFRNRVKKETQSANKSRFRESSKRTAQQAKPSPKGPGAGAENLQMSDLLPFGGNPYSFPSDIATGNETQLNTDEVHYASYLNRIAEAVYDPWIRLVREAIGGGASRRLASIDYVTRIEVVMDPQGNVITIKITKSCGIPELDEAARRAFFEVQPFRHPPKELVGPTGDIRLAYGLQVQMGSSFFNISR